jgi:hypothetical protein
MGILCLFGSHRWRREMAFFHFEESPFGDQHIFERLGATGYQCAHCEARKLEYAMRKESPSTRAAERWLAREIDTPEDRSYITPSGDQIQTRSDPSIPFPTEEPDRQTYENGQTQTVTFPSEEPPPAQKLRLVVNK